MLNRFAKDMESVDVKVWYVHVLMYDTTVLVVWYQYGMVLPTVIVPHFGLSEVTSGHNSSVTACYLGYIPILASALLVHNFGNIPKLMRT